MNKISYLLPMFITIGITLILKLANVVTRFISSKPNTIIDKESDMGLMDIEASYDEFKRVSKESLRLNGPLRPENDFLSFFIDHISSNPMNIENNILMKNLGEDYE